MNFLQEHGGIPIKITIDNQDTVNNIVYRINPRDSSETLNAAPNGETIIENLLIDAFITLTPDAVAGAGVLSADLAYPPDLVKFGWIPPNIVG